MEENDKFYCYSKRLHYFLLSMKFRYEFPGVNKNNGKRYWAYMKSEKLDSAIELYNSIKYKYS